MMMVVMVMIVNAVRVKTESLQCLSVMSSCCREWIDTYEWNEMKHGIAEERTDGNRGEQVEHVFERHFVEKGKGEQTDQ